jgi:hypothetical protein
VIQIVSDFFDKFVLILEVIFSAAKLGVIQYSVQAVL